MKRTLGVCYYPEHWPEAQWAEDAARIADALADPTVFACFTTMNRAMAAAMRQRDAGYAEPGAAGRLPAWRAGLYSAMSRQADDPGSYFALPANQVVELGTRVLL